MQASLKPTPPCRPDVSAIEILKNLAAAMEKDCSSLILYENVITATESHPVVTASDLTMMASFSAVERTHDMWEALLRAAGLKIANVYTDPGSIESVFEAELL